MKKAKLSDCDFSKRNSLSVARELIMYSRQISIWDEIVKSGGVDWSRDVGGCGGECTGVCGDKRLP